MNIDNGMCKYADTDTTLHSITLHHNKTLKHCY